MPFMNTVWFECNLWHKTQTWLLRISIELCVIMLEKCFVFGCNIARNTWKEIQLHPIPVIGKSDNEKQNNHITYLQSQLHNLWWTIPVIGKNDNEYQKKITWLICDLSFITCDGLYLLLVKAIMKNKKNHITYLRSQLHNLWWPTPVIGQSDNEKQKKNHITYLQSQLHNLWWQLIFETCHLYIST